MDQSYKTFFKDPAPRRRRKKKRRTPQRVRSDWINLCLCLWSMLVVKRVGHCEWCGGTDILSGHHIVTRGSTKGYKLAWFAEDNGITLCRVCHGIAHGRGRHKTVHDYMKFEEGYLAKRGTSYEKLRIKYGVIHKTDTLQVKIIFYDLKTKCYERGINYKENRKYKSITKRLGG